MGPGRAGPDPRGNSDRPKLSAAAEMFRSLCRQRCLPVMSGPALVPGLEWPVGRGRARPDASVRRVPPVWIGLTVAFVSALITNTAYSLEHDAAAALPPLSPRRPFRSVRLLLRDRRWLLAFAAETVGWLMYVAALRLAPLSLVQAVAASGVAVLAIATARG